MNKLDKVKIKNAETGQYGNPIPLGTTGDNVTVATSAGESIYTLQDVLGSNFDMGDGTNTVTKQINDLKTSVNSKVATSTYEAVVATLCPKNAVVTNIANNTIGLEKLATAVQNKIEYQVLSNNEIDALWAEESE